MPSLRSTPASPVNFVKKPHLAGNSIQNWKDKKISRAIVVAILLSLLATSTPAAPQTIAEAATRGGAVTKRLLNSIRTRRLTSGVQREDNGMPPSPVTGTAITPQRPPSREGLEASVTSLRMVPEGDLTLESRERVLFSAILLNVTGATVQGLSAEWQSSDSGVISISPRGEAVAGQTGTATLTARAGTVTQILTVTVVQGNRDLYGGVPKPTSTRTQTLGRENSKPATVSIARNSLIKRNHAVMAPPPLRAPNEDPLPDDESSSLYLASNGVGSPPGRRRPGAITPPVATHGTENGNKNFNFGLPIVGLPGRSLDASLSLVYNSQVWNKSTASNNSTWVTFDVDSGWPATGFRIGYVQIENQGSYGLTLTDGDGTRHELALTSTNNYDTKDGTFIHYTGSAGSGTLYYPDGTQVSYGASGSGYRAYPTKITDRNGNYIQISYVTSVGPKISSIEDTLSRRINFSYASNGDLVTITRPGLTGDLQVMRFYYDDVTIPSTGLFSGINVSGPSTTTFHTLRYIYLASATETNNAHIGYRFDYSAYGMVYQITQFRGMTVSTDSLTTAGTVTEGTNSVAATTTYNYPTTASSLSDVPTYTTRTDEWAGRTNGGSAPSYSFSVNESTGVSTVTAPDGTVTESDATVDAGQWDDGLISDTYVKIGSTVLSHTKLHWELDSNGKNPRVYQIRSTDDGGNTKATVLTYTTYNNVSVVSERDFTTDGSISSTELRRTETGYVTSSSYTNRHLLHLPSGVQVFPGGSTSPSSRVDYAYDDYGASHANLTARSDIIEHDGAFDPFGGSYDSTTDYRGNVTSVTTYPDATSSSGAITHSTTYDIAGNAMTTQVDCCQLKSFTYSGAGTGGNHDYAYPISVTSGGGSTTLTTSATYDFNTGLVGTTTDENSQVTTYYYASDSLRLGTIQYPNGVKTTYYYGDGLTADVGGHYHFFVNTSQWLDSTHYHDGYRFYDGRGAVAQTFDNYAYESDLGGNKWSTQDIEYDAMGRAYRASNPYYSGGYGWLATNPDGFWTTSPFDHLGRVTQVTMPTGDNSTSSTTTVQTSYDGVYTTVTDQSNKVRRQKVDALGRVIRLDEPTTSGLGATGAPNQATNYTYDTLDNLVRINQGSQDRYFKYDSLSRLIRERQVEQDTNSSYNLSDSITGNSAWSREIDYNSSGLVTDAYDARSVHTKFTYDGLNRVVQIEYLKPSGGTEIAEGTPTAHYYYDSQSLPSGAPSTSSPDSYSRGYSAGRLVAMTYGSTTSPTGSYFGYDNVGRVTMQFQLTGSAPAKYKLAYGYNYLNEVTSETYPSGRALSYAYDDGGRLSSVSDGTTTFASGFKYAPHGGLTSETFGNSMVHGLDYNRRLQAKQVTLKQNSTATTPLQQYDYGYGEFITATIGSTTQWLQGFQYDELGRLKNAAEYQSGSMSSQTYSQGYTFDRYGNRFQSANSTLGLPAVSSSEINAATNRFIATGSTPTTYDAAGDITTDTKFRGMNYAYDANGRQTSAEFLDHTNHQDAVYDCAGQRVQTSIYGTTRTMVYDIFGQNVADYSGGTVTSLERENIYRGGQLLATQTFTATVMNVALSAN